MITSEDIKREAKRLGADIVGIGSIDRWSTAPSQMDPKQIMPRAKSIIALGFRVFRGSLRGVEEGTYFSNYSAMGYGGITYLYMPMTVINLSKMIEDEGYEAVPMGHQSDWRAIDGNGYLFENYARPVAEGKAVPDVLISMRIAGFLCGLGEIGYSKMLLTPEFGPRVRIGIIITDMELEPDPIMKPGTLCNRCMACVRECPSGCIPADKTIKDNVGGYELEWADVDMNKCDQTFIGAERVAEGETGDYIPGSTDWKPASFSPFYHKPRNLYISGKAICGASGCTRACMISLERRGVLKNKFHNPFRTNKPWRLDWSEEGIAKDKPAPYKAPYEGLNSVNSKCDEDSTTD